MALNWLDATSARPPRPYGRLYGRLAFRSEPDSLNLSRCRGGSSAPRPRRDLRHLSGAARPNSERVHERAIAALRRACRRSVVPRRRVLGSTGARTRSEVDGRSRTISKEEGFRVGPVELSGME